MTYADARNFIVDDGNFAEFCDLAAVLNKTHVKSVRAPLARVLSNRHTGLLALALAAPSVLLTENQRKRLDELSAPTSRGQFRKRAPRGTSVELWATSSFDAGSVLMEGTPGEWIELARWTPHCAH